MTIRSLSSAARVALTVSAATLLAPLPAVADDGPFAARSYAESANNPGEDREAALTCLTQAIVYEAAHEPLEGREAVAQVIVNRTRHARYPDSICGVIHQGSARRTGCQFTYVCDGSLRRAMPRAYFDAARPIAEAALDGLLADRVGPATFYHADYVSPRWAPTLDRVGQIGRHIFYSDKGRGGGVRIAAGTGARAVKAVAGSADGRPFAPWGLPLAPDRARY